MSLPLLAGRSAVAPLLLALSAAAGALALGACPTRSPIIVEGEGETGEGEGEGEGGAAAGEGEGEGEGPVDTRVCGTLAVTASAPIAMVVPRTRHAAVQLSDGKILLAGGSDADSVSVSSAELFDPSTSAFTAVASMKHARYDFALAAVGANQAVAFAGFNNDPNDVASNGDLTSVEIFDEAANAWSDGPALTEPRDGLSAFTLGSGDVLVLGGQENSVSIPQEVFLFGAGDSSLTTAGNIGVHGTAQTASLLSTGDAIIAGGFFTQPLDLVDLVDSVGDVTTAPRIPNARRSACTVNDDRGSALFFGGFAQGELDDVERYDPTLHTWSAAGALTTPRAGCGAVALSSCMALVCGSFASTGCDAWDFAKDIAVPTTIDTGANFSFTITQIDATHALVAGGTVNDFDVVPTAIVVTLAPAPAP
ncbi:MAG TPA: kelch repeat-containing protein [Myxococcota bacterium]|jgi:hypothetical protein